MAYVILGMCLFIGLLIAFNVRVGVGESYFLILILAVCGFGMIYLLV